MSRPTVGSSRTRSRGPCKQGARDLDAPHLAAREIARLLAGTSRKLHARQHLGGARFRFVRAEAVQRRVIAQVLRDGQVEIERARLEDHAKASQRLAGIAVDVEAEHADLSAARREKARHEGKQGGLAGAVEAEKRRASPATDREAHIVERDALAIGMRHMLDRQGRLASHVRHEAFSAYSPADRERRRLGARRGHAVFAKSMATAPREPKRALLVSSRRSDVRPGSRRRGRSGPAHQGRGSPITAPFCRRHHIASGKRSNP